MSKLKLTYFDVSGRAESIRLVLQIGGIPFEDERLSMEEFMKHKEAGRFKYGQVPVLEIDGEQFAQARAILRYVSNKTGLYPTDDKERLLADEILDNFAEMENGIIPTVRIQDKEEQKKAQTDFLNTNLLKWLNYLNKQLEKTGTGYYVGNKLSVVDIFAYVLFGWFQSGTLPYIPKDCTQQFEHVQKNFHMVQQHPKIQEWVQKHPPIAQ